MLAHQDRTGGRSSKSTFTITFKCLQPVGNKRMGSVYLWPNVTDLDMHNSSPRVSVKLPDTSFVRVDGKVETRKGVKDYQ